MKPSPLTPNPSEWYGREPSRTARRFFVLTVFVFTLGGLLGRGLVWCQGTQPPTVWGHFPSAFLPSSVLLAWGSWHLEQALDRVRRERSREFRQSLLAALACGVVFIGVQSYGLWAMFSRQNPETASTDVNAFAGTFAAMHGLHFIVAMMFLNFVIIKAYAHRYDHEYYWGVRVCAWFWHALGIAWGAILLVFVVTMW